MAWLSYSWLFYMHYSMHRCHEVSSSNDQKLDVSLTKTEEINEKIDLLDKRLDMTIASVEKRSAEDGLNRCNAHSDEQIPFSSQQLAWLGNAVGKSNEATLSILGVQLEQQFRAIQVEIDRHTHALRQHETTVLQLEEMFTAGADSTKDTDQYDLVVASLSKRLSYIEDILGDSFGKQQTDGWTVRDRVILHGLKETKFNGKSGLVHSAVNRGSDRVPVVLDDQPDPIKIRQVNLRPQPWKQILYNLEDRMTILGRAVSVNGAGGTYGDVA